MTHSTPNMTPRDPGDTLSYLWCVEDEWKRIVRHHGKDIMKYMVLHTGSNPLTQPTASETRR